MTKSRTKTKKLRIFNLVLQIEDGSRWTNVRIDENTTNSNEGPFNSEFIIITNNVGKLIDLKRRSNYVNCLSIENDLDIMCLAETWLISDSKDERFSLEDNLLQTKREK